MMKSNSITSKASSHTDPDSLLGSMFIDGSNDSVLFWDEDEDCDNSSCHGSSVSYIIPFDILNDSATSIQSDLQESSASLESFAVTDSRDEDTADERNNVNAAKPGRSSYHASDKTSPKCLDVEGRPTRASHSSSNSKSSKSKRSSNGAGEKASRSPRRSAGADRVKPRTSNGSSSSKPAGDRRQRVSASRSPIIMRRAHTTGTGEPPRRPKRSPMPFKRAVTLPEVESKASLTKPAPKSAGDGSLPASSGHHRVRVRRSIEARRTRGLSPKMGGDVQLRRSATTSSNEPSSKSTEERQQRREALRRNVGNRGLNRQSGSRSLSPCSPTTAETKPTTPIGNSSLSSLERRRSGRTSRGARCKCSVRESQLSQTLHSTTIIEEKSKEFSGPFTMNEQLQDLEAIQAMEKLELDGPGNPRSSKTSVFGFAGVVKVAVNTTKTAAKACSTATGRLRESIHVPAIGNSLEGKRVSLDDSGRSEGPTGLVFAA